MNAPDQNPSLVDRVAVSVTVLNHLVPSRASVVSDISWLLTRRLSVKVLSYASVTLLYCHCHPSSSFSSLSSFSHTVQRHRCTGDDTDQWVNLKFEFLFETQYLCSLLCCFLCFGYVPLSKISLQSTQDNSS